MLPLVEHIFLKINVERAQKTSDSLPEGLRPFFWDVEFEKLSVKESSYFIISRLMEHGDDEGMRFLLKNYSSEELTPVVLTSRALSPRSRNFWRIMLNCEDQKCTARQYPSPC